MAIAANAAGPVVLGTRPDSGVVVQRKGQVVLDQILPVSDTDTRSVGTSSVLQRKACLCICTSVDNKACTQAYMQMKGAMIFIQLRPALTSLMSHATYHSVPLHTMLFHTMLPCDDSEHQPVPRLAQAPFTYRTG